MWKLWKITHFERRLKWYTKKKPAELQAVTNNLDTFFQSLVSGKKPKPLIYGFTHGEPSDVIAILQTGSGRKLAETRLYVYPDVETDTLYLLTIGDKNSQGDDIQDCVRFVKQLKAGALVGEEDDGHDEGTDCHEGGGENEG